MFSRNAKRTPVSKAGRLPVVVVWQVREQQCRDSCDRMVS